ncbi:MAG: baseplate J/gp47 family protein [Amoebophilaceae bacterium]|nr:baseplate J/gp47 family protein [Amoebophilaceae bacterium]
MNTKKERTMFFVREGTCRTKRLLPELVNNDFLINNRRFSDHLKFLYLYTDLLAYYGSDNIRIEENIWRRFLEKDATVMRSLILHTHVDVIKKSIDKNFLTLRRAGTAIGENKYIKEILGVAQELIILLDYWHKNLSDEDPIRTKLDVIIHEALNLHLSKIYRILKHALKKNPNPLFLDFCDFVDQKCHHSALWKLKSTLIYDENYSLMLEDEKNIIILNDFFSIVFNTIYELKNIAAADYFDTLATQDKAPHMALLMTFLALMQYADAHLNEIPQRMLDHYYRHVLKFNNNPSMADAAYVHFALSADTAFSFIPSHTQLVAKNLVNGEDILFETDSDITINKAKIDQVNVLLTDSKAYYGVPSLATTYHKDKLDTLPFQLFPPLAANDGSQESAYNHMAAMVGSPVLNLSEGKRTIYIKWKITSASFQALLDSNTSSIPICSTLFLEELADKFGSMIKVYVTTMMGWFCLSEGYITIQVVEESCSIDMTLSLDSDVPPLEKLPVDHPGVLLPTQTPTIALRLREGVSCMDFAFFSSLVLEKIDLKVSVQNHRGLVLQNQLGIIDNSQVIEPFGPLPQADSSFYIGSGEIFSKNITALKIHIKWDQLPAIEGGFQDYYQAYPTKVMNEDFKVSISYLNHQHWNPSAAQARQHVPLFHVIKDENGSERLDPVRVIDAIDVAALGITKSNEPLTVAIYDPNTKAGFLKLKFSGPDQVFGHSVYPNLMSKVLIKNIQNKQKDQLIVLNEPYTPRMQSIAIDYEAKESIVLTASTGKEEAKYLNSFLHVTSFGYDKIVPNKLVRKTTLLPMIQKNVSFIAFGIAEMDGTSFSLHIEIGKNSLNPDKEVGQPTWFYLSNNVWVPINKEFIAADGTNGCVQSGIIIFNLPPHVTIDNTCMTPELVWIKVQFFDPIDALPTIVGVYTQAVSVSRVMDKNGVFSAPTLPAYSIQQFKDPIEGVETVVHPFKTFGGRQFENHQAFYRRVSERLRHKNRAIMAWDYEHIILEKFPEIFKVLCVNHTIGGQNNRDSPGHITLVVIAKVADDALGSFPIVDKQLLAQIKRYIQTVSSPFIQFEVINPVYEDVKVSITVKFKPGYEKGFYINRLQQDLTLFFSPWLFDTTEDIKLGGDLPTSKIIDFINKRSYIEGIGNFSILKYVGKVPYLKLDKVTAYNSRLYAVYPWSVMVSAKSHTISAVDKFDTNVKFRYGGLGDMAIGEDLIIGPWEEKLEQPTLAYLDKDVLIPSTEEHYLITKKYIQVGHGNHE